MAPRSLRKNTSEAVVALHAPALPRSRQLAWRSASGWAGGDHTFWHAGARSGSDARQAGAG
eukprot:8529219-Pyramimonas_sp.AAC.1